MISCYISNIKTNTFGMSVEGMMANIICPESTAACGAMSKIES